MISNFNNFVYIFYSFVLKLFKVVLLLQYEEIEKKSPLLKILRHLYLFSILYVLNFYRIILIRLIEMSKKLLNKIIIEIFKVQLFNSKIKHK